MTNNDCTYRVADAKPDPTPSDPKHLKNSSKIVKFLARPSLPPGLRVIVVAHDDGHIR